jgi:predicted nuclease with TOPRIM domain
MSNWSNEGRNALDAQRDRQDRLAQLEAENAALRQAVAGLEGLEPAQLRRERDALRADLAAAHEVVREDYIDWKDRALKAEAESAALKADHAKWEADGREMVAVLVAERDALSDQHDTVLAHANELERDNAALRADLARYEEELGRLRGRVAVEDHKAVLADLAALKARTCDKCWHKTNLNARHYCIKHSLYCTGLGNTCGAWAAKEGA